MSTDLSDDFKQAYTISCGICDSCLGVHVNFHGTDGKIFASAVVPEGVGELFLADFLHHLDAVRERMPSPKKQ